MTCGKLGSSGLSSNTHQGSLCEYYVCTSKIWCSVDSHSSLQGIPSSFAEEGLSDIHGSRPSATCSSSCNHHSDRSFLGLQLCKFHTCRSDKFLSPRSCRHIECKCRNSTSQSAICSQCRCPTLAEPCRSVNIWRVWLRVDRFYDSFLCPSGCRTWPRHGRICTSKRLPCILGQDTTKDILLGSACNLVILLEVLIP